MPNPDLICPYCGFEVDRPGWPEVAHMEAEHLDVVIQRLRDAGIHHEAEKLQARLDSRTAEKGGGN